MDTVSVATDQLGERVGSLAEHGQQIADAMDVQAPTTTKP